MKIYGKELWHHGVEGQKWGVRRYQNEDGSLTSEGRAHYGYGMDTLRKLNAAETKMAKKRLYADDEFRKTVRRNRAVATAGVAAAAGLLGGIPSVLATTAINMGVHAVMNLSDAAMGSTAAQTKAEFKHEKMINDLISQAEMMGVTVSRVPGTSKYNYNDTLYGQTRNTTVKRDQYFFNQKG